MTSPLRGACGVALLGTILGLMSVSPGAQAETARTILTESARRHHPRSEEYLGEITVITRDGKERRKEWQSYRDGPPGASDRLIRFLSPADVRGVGYLERHRPGEDPDEWLYLPSMKRERRIAASDRESAFVGTSFSYEDLDLLEFDPARYDASLRPAETVDGIAVHVVQLVPRTPSAYARKILKLRQDTLTLLSVDFFVKDVAAPVKRLTLQQHQTISGYVVPTLIEMADLRKGMRTIVRLNEIRLDQPQPAGRYTLQNLLHPRDAPEPRGAPTAPVLRPLLRSFDSASLRSPGAPSWLSGSFEARAFAPWGAPSGTPTTWQWATATVTAAGGVRAVRFEATVRAEESSSPQVGAEVFDPADRAAKRAPVSIRTLSLSVPVATGVDIQAGRFDANWGQTDGYSPADVFLPRDLSDPLTEERLPLWGLDLGGERHGVRFETLFVPVLTPWRLVDFDGRHLLFPGTDVTLVETPWDVPRRGFGAARVMTSVAGWDVSGWFRAGERPAPVLVPDLPADVGATPALTVTLGRHFTTERAAGGSIAHRVGGWIVNGELGLSRSPDPAVKDAAIWSLGASRLVRNGLITATIAGNAVTTPTSPLLLFDRALLPLVILAVHQTEPWGSWRVAWLGTFQTVGGVFAAEATRSLAPAVDLTFGADLPHGAALSPATAFTNGKRIRVGIRWTW